VNSDSDTILRRLRDRPARAHGPVGPGLKYDRTCNARYCLDRPDWGNEEMLGVTVQGLRRDAIILCVGLMSCVAFRLCGCETAVCTPVIITLLAAPYVGRSRPTPRGRNVSIKLAVVAPLLIPATDFWHTNYVNVA